jgi:hypothetical protein
MIPEFATSNSIFNLALSPLPFSLSHSALWRRASPLVYSNRKIYFPLIPAQRHGVAVNKHEVGSKQ